MQSYDLSFSDTEGFFLEAVFFASLTALANLYLGCQNRSTSPLRLATSLYDLSRLRWAGNQGLSLL